MTERARDVRQSLPRLATAVVGAGPAGLLFCAVTRILLERRGGDPLALRLRLFDKREGYARTHRLRMGPEPYRAIARDLSDPRFDALLQFLEEEDFKPEVNRLEENLQALAGALGVRKEVLAIGPGPGETSLAELRRRLEADRTLEPGGRFTIVAADSVHSAVRELSRGGLAPVRHVHQRVARLRVTGPGLPARLGAIHQVRLSKVLGSILDYRLNKNGFAEMDLFLAPADHAAVRELGATPKAPLALRSQKLSALRAPLFRRVVEHLERGFGEGPCEVVLQSGFQLEHTVMPKLVLASPEADATVFLVGDAGISLPFFRGMACLASCVHSLSHVHVDMVSVLERRASAARTAHAEKDIQRFFLGPDRPTQYGDRVLPGKIERAQETVVRGQPAFVVLHHFLGRYGTHVLSHSVDGQWHAHHHLAPVRKDAAEADFERWLDPARRYDAEVDAVKRREIGVVRSRARLIALVREIVRVSALLPFPIQSWFLSAPAGPSAPDASGRGVALNAAVALLAAALALGGPALAVFSDSRAAWLAAPALLVQAAGGVVYHAVHSQTAGAHGRLRAVWRTQTLVLFAGGIPLALFTSRSTTDLVRLFAASAWLVLAAMFVVGLYVYERVVARWLRGSDPEPDAAGPV
jgi:hypothetical protein